MRSEILLLFPHQLFSPDLLPAKNCAVCLLEEHLFFAQYNFHPNKLIFHRASMKAYANELAPGRQVIYSNDNGQFPDIRQWVAESASAGLKTIHYIDPADDWLERRLQKAAGQHEIALNKYRSPAFLNDVADCDAFFAKQKKFFQTDFYTWQRRQRNLLLDKDGRPIGGKWSFDAENRKKFPKAGKVPPIPDLSENAYVFEARQYISSHRNWPYQPPGSFPYPVTRTGAREWLQQFLEERFTDFGIYEDAMLRQHSLLHHSLLSPLINVGLLLPTEVLDAALAIAESRKIPLNSLEGFVRQIIGWREFVRQVYARAGRQQRTSNYWQFSRKIPSRFWSGDTGLEPYDMVVRRILDSGYAHHIERLMVLGNLMLLCEFDPNEVYRWFMEMFIDSYDWVMVPNVYGMSQFADGGLMTTKPYISGSNYLLKMGDWNKGPWQKTWDGLFWRFMDRHRAFFLQNPRLAMLVNLFDKMPAAQRNTHIQHAETFLQTL